MQMKTKLILSLIISVTINAFLQAQTYGSFADTRDGNTYRTVKIGHQTWMAENLNYDTERGCSCYKEEILNCDKYGRLYDWNAARYVCPTGWHLPSRKEFESLKNFINQSSMDFCNDFILAEAFDVESIDCASFMSAYQLRTWWTSNMAEVDFAVYFYVSYVNESIDTLSYYRADFSAFPQYSKFLVRCIKK
jgi:uncharacterized protein (TIGR02145 family)